MNSLIINGNTVAVRTTRTTLEKINLWRDTEEITREEFIKKFSSILKEDVHYFNFVASVNEDKLLTSEPMYFTN